MRGILLFFAVLFLCSLFLLWLGRQVNRAVARVGALSWAHVQILVLWAAAFTAVVVLLLLLVLLICVRFIYDPNRV